MSRSVLVTGASKGIGEATVRQFAEADDIADVIMVARKSAEFDALVEEMTEDGPEGVSFHAYEADLADQDAVRSLCRAIMAAHGRVDLLINNAGFTAPAAIPQIDFADFERTIAVNLYAPFLFVQELMHLGNKFELVVNVASTAGINGRSGWLTYSASKAALINMSEVMREELSQLYGTRVVCISPGRCATALRRTLAPDEDPSTIMQPEDVAEVIATLASPVGHFVASQNLVVRL